MHTRPKIFNPYLRSLPPLVWFVQDHNFENMPKMGLQNVVDVYSKSRKKQTNGDRDLKYGLKWLVGCLLIDLGW